VQFPTRSLNRRSDPARVVGREYMNIVTNHVKQNLYSYIVYAIMSILCLFAVIAISLVFIRPMEKNKKVLEDHDTLYALEEDVGWDTWHHVNEVINTLKEYPREIEHKYKMNAKISKNDDKYSWDDPFSWDNQFFGGSVLDPIKR
jgi:hypothetical protein